MINYTNWKSYYKNTHINEYNLKESEHVKLFNTNDLTYKEDNINYMNPYLGEMTMLYYIWKNKIKSDYIIISQYRRDFYNIKFDDLQKDKIQVLIKGYNKLSIKEHLLENDIDPLLITKIEKYLADKKHISINEVDNMFNKHGHTLFYIICFACKWEIFKEICDFIFYIYDYLLPNEGWKNIDTYETYRKEQCNLKTPLNEYNWYYNSKRCFAYIIEIILGNCLPLFYEIFTETRYPVNILCKIEDSTTRQDILGFYKRNLNIQPFYYFIYKNDKIKFDNIDNNVYIYIKENDGYYLLEHWHFLHYDNIDFIEENKFNFIKADKYFKLNMDQYIDIDSIENFDKGNYIIKGF